MSRRILAFDIETSLGEGYAFGKYEQNILGWENRNKIGHMICFAYRWLDEKKTHVLSLKDVKDERELLEKLWELFDKADILMGHNIANFDIKYANGRFVFHDMKPPSNYEVADTLKIARGAFKFPSNSLDDLAFFFGLDGKLETGGKSLWIKCLQGDDRAWKLMKRYNKQDVDVNIAVYERMKKWAKTHPNMGLLEDRPTCHLCGSNHIQRRGQAPRKGSVGIRWTCMDCGRDLYTGLKEKLPLKL